MNSPCNNCGRPDCPELCWPLKDYKRHLRRIAKVNPCYDCPDRVPGCHGVCSKYIEWTQARAELARLTDRRHDEADAFRINGHLKARENRKKKGETHL